MRGAGTGGDETDRPPLELLLKAALAELANGARDKSLYLFGTEVAPTAAAAAAGLLALAERAALNNTRERNRWRKVCVDLALAQDFGVYTSTLRHGSRVNRAHKSKQRHSRLNETYRSPFRDRHVVI